MKDTTAATWMNLKAYHTKMKSDKDKYYMGGSEVKNPPSDACHCRRHRFDSWVMKIPWRRKWQPTPVFLPGKSHGQRSLMGYSPWGYIVRHNLATKQQYMEI